MSKRSSINDDKVTSEMILKNINEASEMNVDMSKILNSEQMQLLTTYKDTYNFDCALSFFLSLAIMSHFTQGSYYTYYASSDHLPVQLYLWLLGPSGSGKTYAFKQLEKAITKTEKMFPSTYMKPVMVNGSLTESPLSSIVSHTSQVGLRQHLASNSKILLNDDADSIAETYGLYNVNDSGKEHERNIILCGYDGFSKWSKTTGTTFIEIENKRLSIAFAITGGKLSKNMKNWTNATGFDGTHNRFLYMSIPKSPYIRPQDFQINVNSRNNPTLAHLAVIIHLFGTVRFVFEMSQAERTKFCDASFDKSSMSQIETEQSQQNASGMFTLWNLIIDFKETQDQIPNQQQQIVDFYGKVNTTFPRLACLLQLYINAMVILERVKDFVVYAEGDNQDLIINEDFVRNVDMIIKADYHRYDKTYLPRTEVSREVTNPMVLVEKETILSAWGWYEHHLNIITKLFTIDYDFTPKPTIAPPTISFKQKTLKQLIMDLDFNIFPLSSISVKHPVTEKTGIMKNRPALGEKALQELINDNLLKFNYFLIDTRGRNVKSYMKAPVPLDDDPTRDIFMKNLLKHDIDYDEYCSIYKSSSIPPQNNFSNLTLEIFEHSGCFVNEYPKYRDQLNVVIKKHIERCVIQEAVQGNFVILNTNQFTQQFHTIENLVCGTQSNQARSKRQPLNIINQANKPTVQFRHTTASIVSDPRAADEKSQQIQNNISTDISRDPENAAIIEETFTADADPLFDDTCNSIMSTCGKPSDDKDESSNISTQEIVTKATNKYEQTSEQAVKKAMHSIMIGKSVIYSKTDLTMMCNKQNVRQAAMERLVDAKLLKYGDNLWIEPNRTKKTTKKNSKPIFRPGWLKMCPASNSDVSKFDFIRTLQEHVNLSYDEYLKSFYPHEKENVFTNNNWRLSDEVIKIFQSNAFYKEHIRYDIQRFRPCDLENNLLNAENQSEPPVALISCSNNSQETSPNGNPTEMSQQQRIDGSSEEEDMSYTCPLSTSVKRKIGSHTNFQENLKRIQPRRMKKN
ncbi:unnamed protein product [Adineta ricciae]|uniref:Uncharacterized protein n=1 Tax=Adineta ricciae TaxID=249248 RepID=A0A815R0J5_ADIRI|nr:unnamed protein product [Adineta ricciae]CAF1470371.1 unnamed protein product [Adineta ricciae]